MRRILLWLGASAVLAILLVGGGIYGLSSAKIAKVKQDSAISVANATALTLSQQINLLNRTLNKMAQDPDVINAVMLADPVVLVTVAERLERYFPDALRIRLLLPGVNELDEKNSPRMGFADLDMVRETFANEQPPGIQGYEGADKHLAMTARIKKNEEVVGVILASLNYDFFTKSLQAAAVQNGVIELKQDDLVLGSSGQRVDSIHENTVQAAVAGTSWTVYHHYTVGSDLAELTLAISCIGVPALLIMLLFLFGHRQLSDLLTQDLNTLLKACKAMVANKPLGSYPTSLSAVTAVVASLIQFKHSVEHEKHKMSNESGYDLEFSGLGHFDLTNLALEKTNLIDFTTTASEVDEQSSQVSDVAVERAVLPQDVKIVAEEVKPESIMDDDFSSLFRTHNIIGITDKTLTNDFIYDVGRALGTVALESGCKTIVIGRDGRLSSPAFAKVLAQGIVTTGLNVLDIGRVPTPMLYFVTQHINGRSGVMITASHRSADYNGLTMIIDDQMLVDQKIQQIKYCVASQSYAVGEIGIIESNDAYAQEYIGTISEDIHIARPMLVVLDCGNGVAGELGASLLQALGCEVVELYCDSDGSFPNHLPDPTKPENLAELVATVKHYKADIGIAFDGDGDRLGVVDSNGTIIWPDRLMMLFAKEVLASRPGAGIIYDVKCTRHLAKQITKFGGEPILWKTGHAYMRAKVKEVDAALAGERSGHIFFNDRWFGFADALYASVRLIEILSQDPRSSAEIFSQFPESQYVSEWNILLTEGESFTFMEGVLAQAHFPDGKISTIDGMRVDFPNGWGLVRVSHAMPALNVQFEADSEEVLFSIQAQFRALLEKIKPDIVLPF